MTGADETIFAEAAAWHLASARDDMDWSGFTAWLEADSRHRSAYDEIALADAAMERHRHALAPFVHDGDDAEAASRFGMRKWPIWAGGAIAASLAAILILPQVAAPRPETVSSGGAPLRVALEDGSSVLLAPHSRLTLAGRHKDRLALAGGAYFAIRHDPDRQLAISAGSLEIGDIGTRFDVQTNGKAVRVEVSEGQLQVQGDALGETVQLPAGRRLLFDPAHRLATIAPVTAADVGEWREGRLTYDAAPLTLVASDLARYAGITVSLAPGLAERRFSGTLSIRDGNAAVRDLAQLMGLKLSRRAGAFRLDGTG